MATHYALTVTRNITTASALTDALPAAARINTLLGQPADIQSFPVRLAWARVHLTAEGEDIEAVLAEQRRNHDEELRRTQQDRHLNDARALHDLLVADPSLALAYWFATRPETIDEDTLTRAEKLFTAAAAYAPKGQWVLLARLLTDFTQRLSDDAKDHLVDTLAAVADRYGQPDIAEGMRSLRVAQAEQTTEGD